MRAPTSGEGWLARVRSVRPATDARRGRHRACGSTPPTNSDPGSGLTGRGCGAGAWGAEGSPLGRCPSSRGVGWSGGFEGVRSALPGCGCRSGSGMSARVADGPSASRNRPRRGTRDLPRAEVGGRRWTVEGPSGSTAIRHSAEGLAVPDFALTPNLSPVRERGESDDRMIGGWFNPIPYQISYRIRRPAPPPVGIGHLQAEAVGDGPYPWAAAQPDRRTRGWNPQSDRVGRSDTWGAEDGRSPPSVSRMWLGARESAWPLPRRGRRPLR